MSHHSTGREDVAREHYPDSSRSLTSEPWSCSCGERLRTSRQFVEHIVRAIVPRPGRTETEVKAEALREAADEVYAQLVVRQKLLGKPIDEWLRDRANRIEDEALT